ncbi:MAG: GNAT family N-acetyltransferase, partial [Clostridiales bacterium]|nr:GNAT family N-acetyltransferase [Clostridiales bacterium]
MEIEIRIMQSGDEALIAALEQKCFSAPWSEKMILDAKRLTRAIFYVAEVDGDFAGYAGMMSVLDEGNVFNIAADPKYRRCGVGTALTRALIKYSERMGLSVLVLEARESNVAARALY